MNQRVTGFDLARALAVFGMVIVNFKVAMNADTGNPFLLGFAALFEGRASALFVMLAGIGITFITRKAKASQDHGLILQSRLSLIKRGLLLVVVGLLFTPVWEADILHFYGFYFLIAAALFTLNDKKLLIAVLLFVLAFPLLMTFLDYEKNWIWASLTYENFWSVDGMIRHIVFNGFHPIFPWAAFLLFGMWLGRQNLANDLVRGRLLIGSSVTLLVIECSFYVINLIVGDGKALELTPEEVDFLFSTSIIPPLPQYIVSAGSSAVIAIIGCLYFSERYSHSCMHQWLHQTGKLALTLYIAHVVLGLGVLESMGLLTNQTIDLSLLCALLFCIFGTAFSVLWLRYFNTGPFEWLFRKIAK